MSLSSQDTNVTQYEIMGALAFSHCITIVGDPDQSSESLSQRVHPGLSRVPQSTVGALQRLEI